MVMGLGLDLRLRLLVPAVENAISAPAMRPGDILPSRKGLTVEVNNTDAEGRLVLADALALADEEAPELIVSLATLTGAARVALGPDVPPFFTDDDALAADLAARRGGGRRPALAAAVLGPLRAADRARASPTSTTRPRAAWPGAITAALFLRRFVDREPALPAPRHLRLDAAGQAGPARRAARSRRRGRCWRSWRRRFCPAT